MKKIYFSKMHGIGNDFIVIDTITNNIKFPYELIVNLSNRHMGIGFDQLLIIEPPYDPTIDFHYRIFNANGNEVNQCGNGIRCFARFVYLKGLTKKTNINVSTKNKKMIVNITNNNMIKVNMGEPKFQPFLIPFRANKMQKRYIIKINNKKILCGVVSIGNPHCVIQVKNIEKATVNITGAMLENHFLFPERTNVNFMQIIRREYIRLRVYERDVGETKSCGSGACAAVAVGIIQGLLTKSVYVELPGGVLNINWNGPGHPLYMIGPALHVYDGCIYL